MAALTTHTQGQEEKVQIKVTNQIHILFDQSKEIADYHEDYMPVNNSE